MIQAVDTSGSALASWHIEMSTPLKKSPYDPARQITIRKASERGHANHGWLDTYHTFSFADYFDPNYQGFRSLLVINEDCVQPGKGFPTHGHQDMEIISYVVSGSMAHKDSMGNGSVIRPGELQRMSAGKGVRHSEFNASDSELLHLLQIWIEPNREGIPASYEQKEFPVKERTGNLRLVASPNGQAGSLTLQQDVKVYASILAPGMIVEDRLADHRYGWIQVIRGTLSFNDILLQPGDGVSLVGGMHLEFKAPVQPSDAEFLFFDLN